MIESSLLPKRRQRDECLDARYLNSCLENRSSRRGPCQALHLVDLPGGRRKIAEDLIAFTHRLSRLFSGRPVKSTADEAGVSMAWFKDAFEKGHVFASGLAVDYGTSIPTAKFEDSAYQGDGTDVGPMINGIDKVVGKQELASNIKLVCGSQISKASTKAMLVLGSSANS